MTLKKMLLLASMALAAIAFAAPAAAQAEAYWTHGEHGDTVGNGTGNGTKVELEHNIASQAGGLNTRALIYLTGEVWNDPVSEMGEGKITEHEATGAGTVVGIPPALDCTVTVNLGNAIWPLTLTTDEDVGATETDATVDVENVTFQNTYNQACQNLGIPATTAATGTVEATASSNGDHVDLTLEPEQPGLTAYNPATGVHLSPSPAITLNSEGTPLTMEGEEGPIGVEQLLP